VTTRRFRDLVNCLPGITPKVLTGAAAGVGAARLDRSQLASVPRGVVYELSSRGAGLVRILDQIET
jgi:DNA-binding HxlR family transcriptional regulator